mmetsp:Transcript_3836/g.13217  ORF Transcript_3836/g.13217 Transcript_3836/m.13217 type:complete len:181 (-) Transcript_3836:83-625(-)
MVQAVADFIRGLCSNLTRARAREAAEVAAGHGTMSAERLQLLWGEAAEARDAEDAGVTLLQKQLGLGRHDARVVGRGLTRRAEEEAKQQAEYDDMVQNVANFLSSKCDNIGAQAARAKAEAAAAAGIRSVGKLQRRWREAQEQRQGGGTAMLMKLLNVDESDAKVLGECMAERPGGCVMA